MINNKAAPSYFNGGSLVEYNDYRLYVISKLTKLQMLDHKIITPEERVQSQAVYGTGRLVRYNNEKINGQKSKTRNNSIAQQQQKQSAPESTKLKLDNQNKKFAKNDSDKKDDVKVKRRNSKRLEKSLSLTENECIDKYLELLPELNEDLHSNETSKPKPTKSNKKDLVDITLKSDDEYSTPESLDILPEVPEVMINEQKQLNNLEKDHNFTLNELNKLDIANDSELQAYRQLPEYISPPSPSFSILEDIPESLLNPNGLKFENVNSIEKTDSLKSESDFIPEELPELPELPSLI